MKAPHLALAVIGVLAVMGLAIASDEKPNKDKAPKEPPIVKVARPIQQTVTDYAEFRGRTQPRESVTIIPRVTGFITNVAVKEGAEVKKGDSLFEIDARPYNAKLDAAKAEVELHEAALEYATATHERFKAIHKKDPASVTLRDLDQYRAQEKQAKAALNLARTKLDSAQLNLAWTTVRSPIDGVIGRPLKGVGNLVNEDKTELATVNSIDPIQVRFTMDEATVLRLRRTFNEGKGAGKGLKFAIFMRLPGEEGYPHTGSVDFAGAQIGEDGGALLRATFANPKLKDGLPKILPGMGVSVRMAMSEPYNTLIVSSGAATFDEKMMFVYVVGADNLVKAKQISIRDLQRDGTLRVKEGLNENDLIVVDRLSDVREGMLVRPEIVDMPTKR